MPNRNNKGKKVVISRSRKEKKPTMLLEVAKDEILGAYLNNIYFGKASYGVADAAKTYFGKDVRDLKL